MFPNVCDGRVSNTQTYQMRKNHVIFFGKEYLKVFALTLFTASWLLAYNCVYKLYEKTAMTEKKPFSIPPPCKVNTLMHTY